LIYKYLLLFAENATKKVLKKIDEITSSLGKNQKDLTTMILHLCKHPELAKEMGQNCLDIIRENRGATRRNTQELRQLFESHHIIP